MTNEQRKAIKSLDEFANTKYGAFSAKEGQILLSLIKENQTEIEIYKEELDSIYKALDIERGVARPRTYEIIQALKNTIKCQAKQINLMAEWISERCFYKDDYSNSCEIIQDSCSKEDDCKHCIKQYFERNCKNE